MTNNDANHVANIKKELREAGVSAFGMMKFAVNYLPNVVGVNEQIHGVVYGRYKSGAGLLAYTEGMLIATDRRIIFLDHKPGYTAMDEITYDIVSGVKLSTAGWTAVTLHTRIGDYTIRFANTKSANKFVQYIELIRLNQEKMSSKNNYPKYFNEDQNPMVKLDENARTFIETHDIGVLSTIDRSGSVHGAVVYYLVGENNVLHILTKADTQKAHNTFANHQVAFTIYDAQKMQTVQIQGTAQIEADQETKDYVFSNLAKPRQYGDSKRLPPVTKLNKGSFMVIKITPTTAKFSDYKKT